MGGGLSMTDDNEKCRVCKAFERFYIKGDKRFKPVDSGLCRETRTMVNVKDSCEKFAQRRIGRRLHGRTRYYLNELLLQITALRCLMEEDMYGQNEE